MAPFKKELLSAKPFDSEKHDVSNWMISEKLDGVRAYWDGKGKLWSRQKKQIFAPKWFIEYLPPGTELDGELFAGRGNFQQLVSAVRKIEPVDEEWESVSYHVFDIPNDSKNDYQDRVEILKGYENEFVKPVETWIVKSNRQAMETLEIYAKKGAEGLMARNPFSFYEWKRSSNILKLKKRYDAEAIVVGYSEGTGKYIGKLGALKVETIENKPLKLKGGIEFKVGTGFTDAMRDEKLYPIGTIITFLYTETTNSGTPRFPVFGRVRKDI